MENTLMAITAVVLTVALVKIRKLSRKVRKLDDLVLSKELVHDLDLQIASIHRDELQTEINEGIDRGIDLKRSVAALKGVITKLKKLA